VNSVPKAVHHQPVKAFGLNHSLIAPALVISFLVSTKINWHPHHSYDIWLWDETWYLSNGISDLRHFLYFGESYENAPLYSAFYSIVHHLWVDDPIFCYFYGGVAIITIFIVMSFLSFLAVSRSLVISLACMGMLTIGNAADIWPRVSLAAIIVISVTIIVSKWSNASLNASSIMTIGAFITSFVRPEFVVSLYLFMILTFILLVRRVMMFRLMPLSRTDFPAVISIASLLCFSAFWSFPILHISARGFLAFGQHFAVRVAQEQRLDMDPWINWRRITEESFPGANSIASALLINPATFALFLFKNLAATVRSAISTYVMPITPWRGLSRIIVLVSYIWLTFRILRAFIEQSSPIKKLSGVDKIVVCGILIFITPVAVSCIVISPRSHYLVIAVFLLLLLISTIVGHLAIEERPHTIVAASCILFWFTPTLIVPSQPNLEIIRKLRDLPRVSTMVEIDGGWCTYLLPRCQTIFAYELDNTVNLNEYLDERHVDAIFVSPALLRHTPVSSNPQFANIVRDPAPNGWTVWPINNKNYLLTRKTK
jgi:hypothetical protein